MEIVLYCLFVPIAGLLLWNVISPESAWRRLVAWQYRDPEPHRPSDAALMAGRITCGVVLVMSVGFVAWMHQELARQESLRPQREYQECLERNRGEDSLLTPERWCENLSPTPREP